MLRHMSFHRHLATTVAIAISSLLIGTAAKAEPSTPSPTVHVFPGAQKVQPETSVDAEPSAATEETKEEPDKIQEDTPKLSAFEQREIEENQLAAENQKSASDHYFLGSHYFGKWDLNLAEIEYDQAVRFEPELRAAHRELCLVSLAKLNIPRAIAEFMMVTGLGDPVPYKADEIKELDKKAKVLHYNKALEWASKQNSTESISELQWAVKYAPEDPIVHHSLAYAYGASGDFANAEAEYARTFAENPTDGGAHADYADLLAKKGELDQAQSEMSKAVKLAPTAAAYHVDLGWIAESRNDIPTARDEFEQAVKLSPKHAGLWAHLGRLLEKEGKTGEAEEAYNKALALDPGSAEAQQDLARIKQQQQKQPAISSKESA
jgi:Tfp pilus assembly protein PilF